MACHYNGREDKKTLRTGDNSSALAWRKEAYNSRYLAKHPTLRQFEDIFLAVNNLEGTVRLNLSNVSSTEEAVLV